MRLRATVTLGAIIRVMNATRARRHVVVVDNSAIAKAVGGRIRKARQAAGMTQRDLAGDRYTPAYISALETGGAKPSMAALHYIADRLGADVRGFLGTSTGISNRAVADLDLAAGDYPKAVDEYRSLLDGTLPAQERPLVLLGLAEALCRLDRGALGPDHRQRGAGAALRQRLPGSRWPCPAIGWQRLSSRRITRPRASHCSEDP